MSVARARSMLDSHQSLSASISDYEDREFSPTLSQHEYQDIMHGSSPAASSVRSVSPPPWRRSGSGWFKNAPGLAPRLHRSPTMSPEIKQEDDDEEEEETSTGAAQIPLPETPLDGRSPSISPEPAHSKAISPALSVARKINPFRSTPPHLSPEPEAEQEPQSAQIDEPDTTQNNYIRFSTSLDVLQRTEPIEAVIRCVSSFFSHFTYSPSRVISYLLFGLLLSTIWISMTTAPSNEEVPDLSNLASMTQSFQPAVYYSEVGQGQITELHQTGMAVWDLSESVRTSNMSGTPTLVAQLDKLSSNIDELSLQLTSFFVSIDTDVDAILLVMEWAHRELDSVGTPSTGHFSTMLSNAHNLVAKTGFPAATKAVTAVLGQTHAQRSRAAIERAFHQMIITLEEVIANELDWSVRLHSLMEAIDGQFRNLRRTTSREEDIQDRIESDFLATLWAKTLGPNPVLVRKFQKNKDLLLSIKDRTKNNKDTLTDHQQRLNNLKANLEALRRKLVGPAIAFNTTRSLEEQIGGLDEMYYKLKKMREEQKSNVLKAMYGERRRALESMRSIGSN